MRARPRRIAMARREGQAQIRRPRSAPVPPSRHTQCTPRDHSRLAATPRRLRQASMSERRVFPSMLRCCPTDDPTSSAATTTTLEVSVSQSSVRTSTRVVWGWYFRASTDAARCGPFCDLAPKLSLFDGFVAAGCTVPGFSLRVLCRSSPSGTISA